MEVVWNAWVFLEAYMCAINWAIFKGIKRVAGSSGGAITALMVALDLSMDDMYNFLNQNSTKYMDGCCSTLLYPYYFLCGGGYGFYRGRVLENDLMNMVNNKFDKDYPDFRKSKGISYQPTFDDIYKMYKKELIITGSNISRSAIEYFCPKLTPNMPAYKAVRISAALPPLFDSVVYNGDRYVDGGTMENFPLDVFCGKDSIFAEEKEPTFDRTLGFNLIGEGVSYKIHANGINDEIVGTTSKSTTGITNYATGLVDFIFNRNSEDVMVLINLLNRGDPHSFLKHTIKAYTPCLTTADFSGINGEER